MDLILAVRTSPTINLIENKILVEINFTVLERSVKTDGIKPCVHWGGGGGGGGGSFPRDGLGENCRLTFHLTLTI